MQVKYKKSTRSDFACRWRISTSILFFQKIWDWRRRPSKVTKGDRGLGRRRLSRGCRRGLRKGAAGWQSWQTTEDDAERARRKQGEARGGTRKREGGDIRNCSTDSKRPCNEARRNNHRDKIPTRLPTPTKRDTDFQARKENAADLLLASVCTYAKHRTFLSRQAQDNYIRKS